MSDYSTAEPSEESASERDELNKTSRLRDEQSESEQSWPRPDDEMSDPTREAGRFAQQGDTSAQTSPSESGAMREPGVSQPSGAYESQGVGMSTGTTGTEAEAPYGGADPGVTPDVSEEGLAPRSSKDREPQERFAESSRDDVEQAGGPPM